MGPLKFWGECPTPLLGAHLEHLRNGVQSKQASLLGPWMRRQDVGRLRAGSGGSPSPVTAAPRVLSGGSLTFSATCPEVVISPTPTPLLNVRGQGTHPTTKPESPGPGLPFQTHTAPALRQHTHPVQSPHTACDQPGWNLPHSAHLANLPPPEERVRVCLGVAWGALAGAPPAAVPVQR